MGELRKYENVKDFPHGADGCVERVFEHFEVEICKKCVNIRPCAP